MKKKKHFENTQRPYPVVTFQSDENFRVTKRPEHKNTKIYNGKNIKTMTRPFLAKVLAVGANVAEMQIFCAAPMKPNGSCSKRFYKRAKDDQNFQQDNFC